MRARVTSLSSVLLLLALVLFPESGWASTLTVELSSGQLAPQDLTINQGDTVTWVCRQANLDIRSYTGEWQSPFLEKDASFSYTFNKAGNYVYGSHFRSDSGVVVGYNDGGTITVVAWTNSPPPVTINTPIEGFFFWRPAGVRIWASVTNRDEEVSRVDFLANTNLIATATNAPYKVLWTAAEVGQYALTARVTDIQGRQAVSGPVNVTVEEVDYFGGRLWGIHQVTNGVFVLHYDKGAGFQTCIRASDDLVTWHDYGAVNLTGGTFVDESASVPRRFYRIGQCLGQ